MREEEIKKLIKMEDELCILEQKAANGRELVKKSQKTLGYTAIIWSICAILLLFVTSPLIILLFVVAATPIIILLVGKLIEVFANKKFQKLNQKFKFRRNELKKQDNDQKKFEEEMAVYRK